MTKAIGTVLRALSAIWIAFAVIRILAGLAGITRGNDIVIGLVSLLVAVATFKFGTWLKTREKGAPVVQRVKHAKSAWWRADYGFRLSVFLGVVWAIGCYFWQDDYGRDLGVVFWPPVGLLLAYFGYRKFVVGSPTAANDAAPPEQSMTAPSGDDSRPQQGHEPTESGVSVSNQTSKDRERAMNELINKMK